VRRFDKFGAQFGLWFLTACVDPRRQEWCPLYGSGFAD
jgi:hypothetical protein